ncbi:MAG: ATP-dependent DNA helicase Rep [Chroococcopsis gigantea SAG 12.99]|jgi:hypothetical protein|nr:UvrD-helicase domain-containing protein [Chlorogloea purpurea SAG 13.99]MDV2999534.1 ATP-dependent DNA helicase Rep [Chroococcopsis gigantea SAG 12.99]
MKPFPCQLCKPYTDFLSCTQQTNLERIFNTEEKLISALLELQRVDGSIQVNLRGLAARLNNELEENNSLRSHNLLEIINGWYSRKWLVFQSVTSDVVLLNNITVVDGLNRHMDLARSVINLLYAKLDDRKGKLLKVECDLEELLEDINGQTPLFRWSGKELEEEIIWLHERKLIRLTDSLNLFQQALKVRVVPNANVNTIVRRYNTLAAHYLEQARRTHTMIEYGKLCDGEERKRLIDDYFKLTREGFLENYPRLDRDEAKRPVIQADYNRIMCSLNPTQREIVLAENPALAVIAGPGSGKTRTIVHRIAYLIKVKRVPPDRIMVLAYNRNAVRELRLRVRNLIGELAFGVRVSTFHGIALALLGVTLGEDKRSPVNFSDILRKACDLIERGDGKDEDEETHTRRIDILGNLEYIFVDEYQDVGHDEYRLIGLLAGFGQSEDTTRQVQTNLCVIGDDDQNIYAFRGTDVKYIIEFESQYKAKQILLVENYRSTRSIIEAANNLIAHNRLRCKRSALEQVRIDRQPTVKALFKIAADIDSERGYGSELAIPISTDEVITTIYEFDHSGESFLDREAVLVTTCHTAKGLEFRKVILLTDKFKCDDESERRLFYVGMTRAKEELILCCTGKNAFIGETKVNSRVCDRVNQNISHDQLLYLDLTPRDVNLGHRAARNQQKLIKKMQEGDSLQLTGNQRGGWDILTGEGVAIGALSKQCNDFWRRKGISSDSFGFEGGEVRVRYIFQHLDIDGVSDEIKDRWFVVIPQIRLVR